MRDVYCPGFRISPITSYQLDWYSNSLVAVNLISYFYGLRLR